MSEDKAPERIWIAPPGFKSFSLHFWYEKPPPVGNKVFGKLVSYHRDNLCTPLVATADAEKQAAMIADISVVNTRLHPHVSRELLITNIAAALTATTRRGYEQAREDAVRVMANKSRQHKGIFHAEGTRLALADAAETIAALTPAPLSPEEDVEQKEK